MEIFGLPLSYVAGAVIIVGVIVYGFVLSGNDNNGGGDSSTTSNNTPKTTAPKAEPAAPKKEGE